MLNRILLIPIWCLFLVLSILAFPIRDLKAGKVQWEFIKIFISLQKSPEFFESQANPSEVRILFIFKPFLFDLKEEF